MLKSIAEIVTTMMQRIPVFVVLVLLSASTVLAQSVTTENLQKKYKDSFALFFYNNTLRMINQKEDAEFDELIRDIEKMKLLIIRKKTDGFDYSKLVGEYKGEKFEEIMTSRHQGKTFDIFVREKEGKTKAMLVLVNDAENLFVLDILGSIALNKVTKLYSVLDESGDVGSKIERFIGKDDDKEVKGEEENKE